jgi:hypothetical protein
MRHLTDRAYLPVPDHPRADMLNVEALPQEVQDALKVCREYEAEGAYNPTLVADSVRAWFRYQMRSRMEPE